MKNQRVNRVGERALLRAARGPAAALAMGVSLMAVSAAMAADQPISIKNSTISTEVKLNGPIAQTVTGDRNDVRLNLGTSIRGANLDNSRVTTKVSVNGVIAQTVTGDRNKAVLNLGTDIAGF